MYLTYGFFFFISLHSVIFIYDHLSQIEVLLFATFSTSALSLAILKYMFVHIYYFVLFPLRKLTLFR